MDSITAKSSIGFLDVLTLIFVTLKLTGNIDWSWWLVLSPMLIPAALMIILIVIVGPKNIRRRR